MKRNLVIIAAAVFAVLSGSVTVLARDGLDTDHDSGLTREGRTLDPTTTRSEDNLNQVTETTPTDEVDSTVSQQDKIDARKAELKEKMEAKAAERKEKLEGRRLAMCQNREDNINSLISKSAEVGKAKLARIQAFEAGISKFYVDQNLTSENYDATLVAANEKEALAIAALETMDSQEFDCTAVDGAKPSDTIKSVHETKRIALKEYRDSVQQLLKVVRESFTQKTPEAQDEAQ